jgi:hypothetical protein
VDSSPLSSEEIRAAAEVHRELGPQYSDAVVQSFLEKIDEEVEARIAARIAALAPERRSRPSPTALARRRAFLAGTAVGLAGAGVPLTLLAVRAVQGTGNSDNPLVAIWVVIAVVFIAAAAGLTGAVTVRVSLSARRRAQPAPAGSPSEGRRAT